MGYPTRPPLPANVCNGDVLLPSPDYKQLDHYQLQMRSEYVPEWTARLREAKYPPAVVVLDFETYFDADYTLSKLSTIEYIMDPQFEVLGVSILEMHSGVPFRDYEANTKWWYGEDGTAQILEHLRVQYGQNLERCTLVMHNAAFDATILAFRYGIRPPYVIDTKGLAAHWHSRHKHGLKDLAERYNLPAKGDTKMFLGWTNRVRFTVPKNRKKGPTLPVQMPTITDDQIPTQAEYADNDVMRTWEIFTILLPKLSWFKTELRAMQHTLDIFISPVLEVDYAGALTLSLAMEAEVDKTVALCGDVTQKDISGENSFDDLLWAALEAAGDDPRGYIKTTKTKKGWKMAVAQDDSERAILEQHKSIEVRNLMAAKQALSSWPLHIKRITRIVDQSRATDGKLCVPLKYCGAHTRRWSGGEKINLQNLGSRGHDLVNAVRSLLVAPKGHVMVIGDASQIEARGLAWVAGQTDLCEKFAAGAPIYCEFASEVLGYPVRKPDPDGVILTIEARMKWARNSIGKIGILGCGYGMGAPAIEAMAGGLIDAEKAEKIKTTYRAKYPQIVQFWYDLGQAFTYTARYQKPCTLGKLRFEPRSDCDVVIILPSSGELKYQDVKVNLRENTLSVYNHLKKSWGHTWGGSLTENVVQALSRDVLWEAIQRLEDQGIHTVHHIHDELIAVVPKKLGKSTLAKVVAALKVRPTWAPDLPLDAEGVITTRYGGH